MYQSTKVFSLILILTMILAACGGDATPEPAPAEAADAGFPPAPAPE